MKLHPVHMMVVHFPAALLPMAFLFQVIANFTKHDALASASYYCLMAGVIAGWVAIITGLIDLFLYVLRSSHGAPTGWRHAVIQTVVVSVFTVVLALEYKDPSIVIGLPAWLLATKAFLVLLLFGGNFLGGALVLGTVSKQFRHKKS